MDVAFILLFRLHHNFGNMIIQFVLLEEPSSFEGNIC